MYHQCDECGKPATHHFTKIVNGQVQESHLCDEHAAQSDTYLGKSNVQMTLEQLLSSLYQHAQQAASASKSGGAGADVRCSVCHLPLSAYRNTMILGCDRCYESFEERLRNDLRKFHGSTKHAGRRPPNFKPRRDAARALPIPAESEAAARVEAESDKAPAVDPEKTPAQGPQGQNVAALREEMKQAVAAEDFEEAARLRDIIRGIEDDR